MRIGRMQKSGRWKGAARGDYERRRLREQRMRELREVAAERRRILKQRHLEAIAEAAKKFDVYA